MTIETDQSTNRQWAEDVSPMCDVREYDMSEKAEATPGPWKVGQREELQNFVRRPIEAGEYGEVVAYVVGATNPMLDWYAGAKHYEANAHMIAASRDMYTAIEQADVVIEQALDAVDGETRERLLDLMDTMHEALIKARGETQ